MLKVCLKYVVGILLLLQIPFCGISQPAKSKNAASVRYELPYVAKGKTVTNHFAYSLLFDVKAMQACWVAYSLESDHIGGWYERTNRFVEDPLVKSGTATNADYAKSGYDRGHLCPAGDMSWSEVAMRESFYYSNMSPQEPSFNRGIWKKLEEQVRTWGRQYGKIYIAVGPVLEKNLPTIGIHRVAVPRYFYKVILDYNERTPKAIGFIIPNMKSSAPIQAYAVTVDNVEKVTGINFFYNLPDSVETKVESQFDLSSWDWTVRVSSSVHKSSQGSVSVQCHGITAKGARCKRMTKNPNGYCFQHGGN